MMYRILPIALIVSTILMLSCQNDVFKYKIAEVLDIKEVQIDSSYTINPMSASCLIERYVLSEQTTHDFLVGDKKFPDNEKYGPWHKSEWVKSSTDSLPSDIKYYLNLYWNDNLKELQMSIKKALRKEDTYYAYYYRKADQFIHHVQLYVYDISTNTLYIVDSSL